MLKRLTCSWCLPSGGAPLGPLPKTAHSYRIDTHHHTSISTQVRYCRYSRLHRSELPKTFWYVDVKWQPLGWRAHGYFATEEAAV